MIKLKVQVYICNIYVYIICNLCLNFNFDIVLVKCFQITSSYYLNISPYTFRDQHSLYLL